MQIAIVGAGMAGLSCATRLAALGHDVALFDKGRGPGGRMATRRVEADGTMLRFDHGAQYFTARDPRFVEQVARWEREGVVARWDAAGEDAWVGTPAMNAPIKAMAGRHDVQFGTRIEQLLRDGDGWQLDGEGAPDRRFDAVMAAFEQRLPSEQDSIRHHGAIGWAARNNAKPGRGSAECWVVQASPDWSRTHLEDEATAVETALLDQLANAIGAPLPPRLAISAHRWRFARSGAAGKEVLWDAQQRIGVCGDWLIGPRVEAAYLSGRILAETVGGR
ncbi:MAG TPA: NAD/FAD-dependent oxidoreductase [Erythrobacter sp.]|nr:NAD/FAD-dependent oxidoreductase [Erythrobacter sp.]